MSRVASENVRRRMSGAARREQILDVALAIVDREGFHAATPARIADEAGVHRTLIYQQFGDVTGLFVALVDREGDRDQADFAAAVASAEGLAGLEQLRAVLARLIEAIDENPASWRLFLSPPLGAPAEFGRRLEVSQERVRKYLADVVADIGLDQLDPELTARVMHAGARELLAFRLENPGSAAVDRLLEFADRMGAGLLMLQKLASRLGREASL